MKPGRRYHTPEISGGDRLSLWKFLGWAGNHWGLLEHDGTRVLNCIPADGSALSRWIAQWPPKEGFPDGIGPLFILGHGSRAPVIVPADGHDLWRELLPHPLSLLRALHGQVEIAYSSPGLRLEVEKLLQAFQRLETSLQTVEFTLLTFISSAGTFSLLIHAVRGKCVRLGTSDEIQALAENPDKIGEWNAPIKQILIPLAGPVLTLTELSDSILSQTAHPPALSESLGGPGAETCNALDFLIPT